MEERHRLKTLLAALWRISKWLVRYINLLVFLVTHSTRVWFFMLVISTRVYDNGSSSSTFSETFTMANFAVKLTLRSMTAVWPSGTERWFLRKQYCDPISITAAGRLLRHIRGWLETRRERAHFPVTLTSPFLLSSFSCKSSVEKKNKNKNKQAKPIYIHLYPL